MLTSATSRPARAAPIARFSWTCARCAGELMPPTTMPSASSPASCCILGPMAAMYSGTSTAFSSNGSAYLRTLKISPSKLNGPSSGARSTPRTTCRNSRMRWSGRS